MKTIKNFCIIFFLIISGCSTTKPQPMQILIKSGNIINSEPQQPVQISFFQLCSTSRFQSASFDDLTLHPQEYLQADILALNTLMIKPKQQLQTSISILPNTIYLGIVVAYQNFINAKWRQTLTILQPNKKIIIIQILNNAFTTKINDISLLKRFWVGVKKEVKTVL